MEQAATAAATATVVDLPPMAMAAETIDDSSASLEKNDDEQHNATTTTMEEESGAAASAAGDEAEYSNNNNAQTPKPNEATSTTTNTTSNATKTLIFDDFVDLQTRLVLLPYIESEGKGAVIMSFAEQVEVEGMILQGVGNRRHPQQDDNVDDVTTTNASLDFLHMGFTEILATIRTAPTPIGLIFESAAAAEYALECDEPDRKQAAADDTVDGSHYEEKKDDGDNNDDGQRQQDPLTSLATPQAPTKSLTEVSTTTAAPSIPAATPSPTRERQPISTALDDNNSQRSSNKNNNSNSISTSMFALSAWGLRMKAQSEKLATDAMKSMNANNSNSSATAPQRQALSLKLDGNETNSSSPCEMYLQTNLGAYFCISGPDSVKNDKSSSSSKSLQVTTSSLLCIRKSAKEPLVSPTQPKSSATTQYSFQWYRSTSNKTRYRASPSVQTLYLSNDSASIASKSTHHSLNSGHSSSSSATTDGEWVRLEGATYATFQPNTTLVGRRLRCIVTIRQATITPASSSDVEEAAKEACCTPLHQVSLVDSDDVNDDDDDDDQSENDGEDAEQVICDLSQPVRADMVLFNGARQAMVRGAKFGNMLGRTAADPKPSFRVEVGMARKTNVKTQRTISVNAVHIYKLCTKSNDYIPLTDQPLLQVSARADTNISKNVDLIFTALPPTTELHPDDDDNAYTTHQFMTEFCVPDEILNGALKLELEAPNRLTRESFLLALGIANHQGKPSLLEDKSVLFRDEVSLPPANVVETTSSQREGKPSPPKGFTVPQGPSNQASTVDSANGNDDDVVDDDSLSTASGSDGEAICSNLPNSPPRNGPSAVSQPSPSGFFSCQSSIPESSSQPLPPVSTVTTSPSPQQVPSIDPAQIRDFQRELEFLKSQLARKDRSIVDLQRQVQRSEASHQKTKHNLQSSEQELKQALQDCERIQISKRQVERSMQAQYESMQKAETSHKQELAKLDEKIQERNDRINDLEKANRALQNEKAVLGAAIEARESKLTQMGELKEANQKLSLEMEQQGTMQAKLDQSEERCQALQKDLKSISDSKAVIQKDLDDANRKLGALQKRIDVEHSNASTHQSQLDTLVKKNQQLKGERNSYKQKNDSLSKEISRLCRTGRTIRDIEKIVADHEALVQEAEVLRVQKRKALEEAHKYRTSYEQMKSSEQVLGVEEDTLRTVERSTELERLLTEMTDYVHAKEMQLETMRQVNEALQEEIHNLAKANLRKNEV